MRSSACKALRIIMGLSRHRGVLANEREGCRNSSTRHDDLLLP